MRKYKFKVIDKNEGSCIVHPNSSFYRRYPKDTNVIASIDSLGIMVFHTRKIAELFIVRQSNYVRDSRFRKKAQQWKIKRVLPIGKGKTPKLIAPSGKTEDIKMFMKLQKDRNPHECWFNFTNSIKGTICYPGVYVID